MSNQLRNPRGLPTAVGAAALLLLGLAFAVATGADARGQATTIGLIASMNASSEVPAPSGNVSGALGTFTGTATKSDTGAALQWQMTFSGLTGPATAAHIHVAARGQPGPVVVPLCGPCTSPASGTANVDAALLAAIHAGGAYVNIHTDTNRAGEVRGQVGVVAPVRVTLNAQAGGAETEGERPSCHRLVRRDRGDGRSDRHRDLAAHVRPAHRQGCGRAHPHREERKAGPRHRGPLRPLSERCARRRATAGGCLGCDRGRPRVCERAHDAEPGR